ncbi:MAG: ATP-binding protein [Streptomycetales bacterium]
MEDRHTDIDDGIDRLISSLTRQLSGCRPLDEVVDRVLDDLDRRAGHDDDVALLLVRFTPEVTPVAAAEVEVTSAAEVRSARTAAADVAGRAGLTDLAGTASLVASELTTNALSHAPAPALLRVYATLTRLVIEVFDPGGRLPHRAHPATDDEHGRGLAVVEHLTDRWGVRLTDTGKATWAELRRGASP